ncbi:LysR family transcriptional regulator [Cupriavidus agavae]|uniref:LysR family transcriptional regulator n=1 Tax=Cupriavidus agavae TaxID=1001822 RepID=A0A4Q7S1Z0_9BURK|nr:LysR family transcriptional regulator [Cupriavidus agavae]RZT39527.1 LysR family transcriptional regulator [Cupriavidus agavae]
MSMERLHGLAAFVRAVEAGSFTAAARLLGTTPSAVSKSMSRLEARLGVRLFQRSTRAFVLTAEGRAYYDRVAPLVRGLEEASEVLAPPSTAAGRLRVSMPGDLGRALLGPITATLMPRHPRLALDISLGDQHVDLVREGFDLALRAGHAADSALHARPLGTLPLVLVAAPAYLAAHGEPASLTDLAGHRHVRYRLRGEVMPLDFAAGPWTPSEGIFDADNGDALRAAALQGLGIAQLLKTTVQADLDAGRLRAVLPQQALRPVPLQILHGFGRRLPLRAKVFVDFLAAELARQAG